ncbi:MAG: DMT family transporter, partial [Stackebrandtia sp.]
AGVGPGGRRGVTTPRVLGALLAIAAVSLAQAGREAALGMWWLAPAILAVGVGLAVQAAFNGRINEISGNPLSTGLVNFVAGTGVLYAAIAVVAAAVGLPVLDLPSEPWLYLGGVFGAAVVICVMFAIGTLGVLRVGLGVVAGQLAGALALDVVIARTWPSPWVVAGVVLTAAAVAVSGRRAAPVPDAPVRERA